MVPIDKNNFPADNTCYNQEPHGNLKPAKKCTDMNVAYFFCFHLSILYHFLLNFFSFSHCA